MLMGYVSLSTFRDIIFPEVELKRTPFCTLRVRRRSLAYLLFKL